ncbi:MAG: hypothetical protein GX558_11400 [Clostridiales bacterium]|nr:hypothetical protein [Clostridiales bacterium]
MRMSVRGVNAGEQYAARASAVRRCFSDCELFVSLGALGRDFQFDGQARHRPSIRGAVVASLQVNRRDGQPGEGILQLYVIRDPEYRLADRARFEDTWLPRMRSWYRARMEPTGEPAGVYQMLVEWADGDLRGLEIRFA